LLEERLGTIIRTHARTIVQAARERQTQPPGPVMRISSSLT
jgi:hypothetical protein